MQGDVPILVALARVDLYQPAVEVDMLDAKLDDLRDAQPGVAADLDNQPIPSARCRFEQPVQLGRAEEDRQPTLGHLRNPSGPIAEGDAAPIPRPTHEPQFIGRVRHAGVDALRVQRRQQGQAVAHQHAHVA
jgi:hypothetical protein